VSTNTNDNRLVIIWATIVGLPVVTLAFLAWSGLLNDGRSVSLLAAGIAAPAGLVLAVSAFRAQATRLRIGLAMIATGMLCLSVLRFLWATRASPTAVLGATLLALFGTWICLYHQNGIKGSRKA
jgi:hypothetical protein